MKKSFCLIMTLLLLTGCVEQHILFENGASDYCIVVDSGAPQTEQYAAAELQTWLKEVSGATLPIKSLQDCANDKRLIVGYNDLVKQLTGGEKRPEDRDDAFTYQSHKGDILLWGGSKRGTLYAVYSFLEKELGCRWYSSKVSVAPKQDTWAFDKLYNHESPAIQIRDNCVLDVRANPAFSARMRNNFIRIPSGKDGETIDGSAEGYWGVHSMYEFVSPQEYYDTHPEYFSLINGKRANYDEQLCLSNPEVLQICTEKVRKVMREQPDYLIYSMEQKDMGRPCECEKCQAIAGKYGGESGLMIWFVNQVADAVKDEFPDKYIGTFAYRYTRHAPKDIAPRENVVVRLCSIECCMLHDYDKCEKNLSFVKDMKDWASIAPHLYIWDYVTDFHLYPLPMANWKTLQSHIRDFQTYHAIGILEEGDYQTVSCELRELRAYLLSKLMWNPDEDVESLIKDFTNGYYGAAGTFVRQYLELEERILRREGMHTDCYATVYHPMYTSEFIKNGRKLFAEAKEAVKGDEELLRRVEAAEFPLCFLLMETNPMKGFETGAFDLFKKVVKQEGIERISEGMTKRADDCIAEYEKLKESLENVVIMPAQDVQPTAHGVRYTRYEGPFLTTEEMVKTGQIVQEGIMSDITIDTDPYHDHFGYVFETWLQATAEGIHRLNIISDDGAVVYVDGKEVINIDGSHHDQTATTFLGLEKGYHSLKVLYFDDCEGQKLDIRLATPDGNAGFLPAERLFVVGN